MQQSSQHANHDDKTPWVLYFDEENQHHYYFNTETEESMWQEEAPSDIVDVVARKHEEEGPGDEAGALGEGSARPPSSPAPAQAPPSPSPDFSSPTKVSPPSHTTCRFLVPNAVRSSQLIRNFNESYNKHFSPLEQQQEQLQADPMVQVASTLQVIMTQFAQFTQNQALQFEAQRRQQQKAVAESSLNLSLARPTVGQFEDTEEDMVANEHLEVSVGGGSDMGDIGVSAIAVKNDVGREVRRKIKSVESSLKDKKVGMMVGGGENTRRMKRDLEDIRERRMTMRTGVGEEGSGAAPMRGREEAKSLFGKDFNFASALVRNVMTADTGEAKDLIRRISSPPTKGKGGSGLYNMSFLRNVGGGGEVVRPKGRDDDVSTITHETTTA